MSILEHKHVSEIEALLHDVSRFLLGLVGAARGRRKRRRRLLRRVMRKSPCKRSTDEKASPKNLPIRSLFSPPNQMTLGRSELRQQISTRFETGP